MAEDIIYGILSRLPIKSLARFRCVSKLWLKYINDPYLHTIHVKEEPTPIMFQNFPDDKLNISFLHGVRKEPVLELCFNDPVQGHGLLLASCNGLTLVCYELNLVSCEQYYPFDAGTYRFAVFDPLTKQRHDLPPISIKIKNDMCGPCDAAGIGFDDSTNTLKSVFFVLKDPEFNVACTMVHSSGTGTWREIAQIPAYPIGEGVFGHGRLHWLTHYCNDGVKVKIMWFDLKTEDFGLTDPPQPTDWINDREHLGDLNGEVGFGYVSPVCIKLWTLKQEDEWVSYCCFDCSLIMSLYKGCDVDISGCWNKDGDILLTCKGGERLFVYALKSGDLRQVLEQCDQPCFAEIRMYQSTLFSLNYFIKN